MLNGYKITHVTYKDICDDFWYGKSRDIDVIDFVMAEESEVKALVDELNEKNNSFYARKEPDDEYDDDYMDEDYYRYDPVIFLNIGAFREEYKRYLKEGE